jgi:hypothetical protein
MATRRLNLARRGMTWEDSRVIARRKSVWMVLWLRARRDGDTLRDYYRRMHFAEKAGG